MKTHLTVFIDLQDGLYVEKAEQGLFHLCQ